MESSPSRSKLFPRKTQNAVSKWMWEGFLVNGKWCVVLHIYPRSKPLSVNRFDMAFHRLLWKRKVFIFVGGGESVY
ncbi:hypothetical protein JTE90_011292 [Oedothorax gibbosus]|uniref:Uncharacterized protein n=1 Tax=Oedothorax gibbosus TaxID=931172 RepID=A0AAV6VKD6_9ARAC|nr:hypothetical protein JTE90_011292 [Oedothorax gibbosus]